MSLSKKKAKPQPKAQPQPAAQPDDKALTMDAIVGLLQHRKPPAGFSPELYERMRRYILMEGYRLF